MNFDLSNFTYHSPPLALPCTNKYSIFVDRGLISPHPLSKEELEVQSPPSKGDLGGASKAERADEFCLNRNLSSEKQHWQKTRKQRLLFGFSEFTEVAPENSLISSTKL